ncbi:MAG: hypothetical protein ACE5EL_08135, partial [Anaerolineae bacterium]
MSNSEHDCQGGAEGAPITWVARSSLWSDPVVAKQLAFVFGFPLLFLFALLLVISRPLDLETVAAQAKFTLMVAAVIAGLLAFVVVVLLRGRTETRYTVDAEGVKEETAGFLRYMNVVKALLLLSGRPSAMGAGLLAQGPTSTSVPWQRVDGFLSDPVARTVTLNRGGREE